jgi:hypothetical protein
MKKHAFLLLIMLLLSVGSFAQHSPDSRLYEMRVYYASPNKFEDLMSRFRNHTLGFFKKYDMKVEGFWIPLDNASNKMVYVLSYPSQAARDKSWKEFMADPAWINVMKQSAINGEIVAKVESTFLKTTDFSPHNLTSVGNRVFELRTYKTTTGNLENLLARFKNYTLDLFSKHGMTNLIYWTPTEKNQGADDTLIYWLAHKDKETGLASFKAFGADPQWQAVKKASEEKAGGSLTTSVVSEYFMPADFSPVK